MSFVARHGRIELRVPVILALGEKQVTAETRNIGLGGVFVATGEPAPVSQRLSLRLALPGWDESHFVNAEVRWVRPPDNGYNPSGSCGIGVRFVTLSLYVAAALDNFVRSHTLSK